MLRRILDLLIASLSLLLLAPLLLAVVLAVLVTSPGNPFYRGERTGLNGRKFRMWKFRTMVPGAAKIGPPVTSRDDSRITSIGRFLRRSKLDELPQLFNVLTGDLTLVGPRPEAPEITRLYNSGQRRILSFKPGVTGPVQLTWSDEADSIPPGEQGQRFYLEHLVDRKIGADLVYLGSRTTLTDLRFIGATAVLVCGRLFGSLIPGQTRGEVLESTISKETIK